MAATRIIIPFIVCLLLYPTPNTSAQSLPPGENATLVKVVDGDTIKVRIGDIVQTVRYIGVDSPELGNTDKPSTCYATEATDANAKLVDGQALRLQKDKSETDKYDRLLRYVYLPDGKMVNELLVQGGFAFAKAYKPDVRFSARFTTAQRKAQVAKAGLWSACRVVNGAALPMVVASVTPTQPTATLAPAPASDGQPTFTTEKGNRVRVDPPYHPCLPNQVKGNRNSKIYHSPGQRDYAYTFKNVQCFDTASQAEGAGFRAAKQ